MTVTETTQRTESANTQVIDLTHMFRVLWRAKWRIFLLSMLCSILAVLVVLNLPQIYRASSTLLIEAQQARAVKIEEVYGFNSMQQEYYQTQFEILKSRAIAERVFRQLNLAEHPEFQSEPSLTAKLRSSIDFLPKAPALPAEEVAERRFKRQVDSFMKRLTISPVRRTQLVVIHFEAEDPRLAQQVTNAIGEAYIDSQLEARMGITQQASSWLGGRLDELRLRLDESEQRLHAFRDTHNLVDVAGVTSLDARELERLSEDLTRARSRKAQADTFLALLNRHRNDMERLQSLPEVTSHPSIQNIKREQVAVERRQSELAKVYGPRHPRMIAVQAEVLAVQDNLNRQIRNLINGIEEEAQTASRNLASLEQQIAESRGAFSGMSGVEAEYRRIKREVETNRVLFETFLSRQRETEVTSDYHSPVARFTDRAVVPTKPVKPQRKLIVMLVFVATFGLGMVMALVSDALNDTIKTAKDAEDQLMQRALGYIPKSAKRTSLQQQTFAYFDESMKLHAEAVRSIRTSLKLMAIDKPLQLIEVTSSLPAEGKSTVSLNLAFSFSSSGRVLLIDADMRKPTLGKRLEQPAYQPGLANYLSDSNSLDECIVRGIRPNVDLMPAGSIPLNPLELLSSERKVELLELLKQQYDTIIIDTPPVLAVSDALVLSPLVDATIMVVKADATRRGQVNLALGRLAHAHARIYGVVLNQLDTGKAENYYGHGGYGYYQTYEQAGKNA
ncbi:MULTISPECIES: GumC family protein [Alkalimonas]|uniref:non-specific protein-tyrosine kinase n=1 Tax=Alkalimonas mucilaginosa TaxID=3057676 RepID=A0ABU7JFN1_9GAMM|nr:polysaccharide biosynthesis tyrosine autokinase [Alkalimonas sp. MEB004]MEE2024491.1 polysaccharide biosynthesis tyrosine autokinase [Alkalimonas sp. MEB004]